MTSTQSNTQPGITRKKVTTASLLGKEGYLAKLVDGTGEATVELAGVGDVACYVITEGADVGYYAEVQPLSGLGNFRAISGGTITGGTVVAPNSAGKLRAAASGDIAVGVLEEDASNGSLPRVRPGNVLGKVTLGGVSLTAATVSTANATDLASAEALANALKTAVNAIIVDVAAIKSAIP